jgi:AcrR family transcriptional regulator
VTVAPERSSKPTLTERQAARRDWIVQAATELASEGGYDAVQMREVSARANVALGTLYRYFSSKDQLLVAVMGRWAKELQAQIEARPPRGQTPADRVTEVLRRAARALQEAPELTASLVTAMSSMSSDDPPALAATREVYDTVTALIRGALRPGEELGNDVIRVLAMVWFAALFARVRGWEDPRQMGDDLENAVRLLVPS